MADIGEWAAHSYKADVAFKDCFVDVQAKNILVLMRQDVSGKPLWLPVGALDCELTRSPVDED